MPRRKPGGRVHRCVRIEGEDAAQADGRGRRLRRGRPGDGTDAGAQELERPLEVRHSLARCAALERQATRLERARHLLLGLARLAPVVGERRHARAPGLRGRDRLGDPPVERATRRGREVFQQPLAQLVVREAPALVPDLEHRGRRGLLHPGVERKLGMERPHQVRVDHTPDHGGGPQPAQHLRRQAREPPAHDPLHTARDHPLGQLRVADALEPAGALRQRAHHLDDEEGQPLGLALEERHQRGAASRGADHGLAERGDLTGAEPAEREHARPLDQPRQAPRLVVAEAPDHEEGEARGRAGEPREELQTLAAHPLQVLEQHQHRRGLEPEHLLDREEEPGLRRVGVEHGRVRDVAAEERAQVGHDRLEHARLRVAQLDAQDETGEHVAPEVIGTGVRADALAAHHEDRVDEGPHPELVEQARLAHTTLSAHQPDRAPPDRGLAQQRGEARDVLLAPDQGRGLEEALARRDRLQRERLLEGGREGGDHLGRVGVPLGRLLGEQPAEDRTQPGIEVVAGARQHRGEDVVLEPQRVVLV